jgi:hypothetical protein
VKSAIEFGGKALHLAKVFPRSLYRGSRDRRMFEQIDACCLFIGYPRSGHSLIGSLIGAHPHAVIGHELDLLKYVYARFGRVQLCHLALESSRAFTEAGRRWSGHRYAVPGEWQGRFEEAVRPARHRSARSAFDTETATSNGKADGP